MVFIITPLFTQEQSVYVKTFPVIKVFSHRFGYKVLYWTGNLEAASVYIPMDWFEGTTGKAQLVLGTGKSYPYMSIVWVDGELDHVYMHLRIKIIIHGVCLKIVLL